MNQHIENLGPELELKPSAIEHLKEIIVKENIPETYGLRVMAEKVQGEIHYNIGFDKPNSETDHELAFDGIKVLIDSSSAAILNGTIINYQDTENQKGFLITNPNEKNGCGCGSGCGCH